MASAPQARATQLVGRHTTPATDRAAANSPIAPPPTAKMVRTPAEVAGEVVRGWLKATAEEAAAIAKSLPSHTHELRAAMAPRESFF